jgi:hypothetical protein
VPKIKKMQIMKNLIKKSFVVLVIATLLSCSNKSNTPEAVAEKFLNHLNKQEYSEAKKLGTQATGEYLDMLESQKKATDEELESPVITELSCDERENEAFCTYKTNGETQSINLVKQEDQWLVDMKKETPSSRNEKQSNSTNNSLRNRKKDFETFIYQNKQYMFCDRDFCDVNWYEAIEECEKLKYGGYDDWLLPDASLMEELYSINSIKKDLYNTHYWTKTEINDNQARGCFYTNLNFTESNKINKNNKRCYRPVRIVD